MKLAMARNLLVALAPLILVFATQVEEPQIDHVTFPGAQSFYPSPDGRFTLTNIDDDNSTPAHRLLHSGA